MSSADVTDCSEADGKYESVHDSHVEIRMEDDVDPLGSNDLDVTVDMGTDGDNEKEDN
jgi:hypothetical protein